MVKAAEELGFSAKGVKGDQEAFFIGFLLPAIAHVVVDGSLLHYVVIHTFSMGLNPALNEDSFKLEDCFYSDNPQRNNNYIYMYYT